MSLFIALLVGSLIGGIAGYVVFKNIDYLVVNILLGIVGSILGLAVYFFMLTGHATDSLFNATSLLCSVIGALLFVLVFGTLQRLMPRRAAHVDSMEQNSIQED